MANLILSLQLVSGAALMALILLQVKGTGISAVFGGEGMMYRSRRGVEKLLHRGTIVMALIFLALAVANVVISR